MTRYKDHFGTRKPDHFWTEIYRINAAPHALCASPRSRNACQLAQPCPKHWSCQLAPSVGHLPSPKRSWTDSPIGCRIGSNNSPQPSQSHLNCSSSSKPAHKFLIATCFWLQTSQAPHDPSYVSPRLRLSWYERFSLSLCLFCSHRPLHLR